MIPKAVFRNILFTLALTTGAILLFACAPQSPWTQDEIKTLHSLSLAGLPPLAPDKSNRVGDEPRAAALGHKLFFDARFSANGQVSCAACHIPTLNFQDTRAHGRGIADTRRRTSSIVGTAYQAWFFWDGRKDSQWSQALAPLEHPDEHGGDRAMYAHLIDEHYRAEYEALFGALPDLKNAPAHASPAGNETARAAWARMSATDQRNVSRVYANIGKALAAYERKIMPGETRFDQYVAALERGDFKMANEIFSGDERAGLKLFVGKANCAQCHNTPLFSDGEFHNTGVPQEPESERDLGRVEGAAQNFEDEFKCWSEYSDDAERDCPALRYMNARVGAATGAFKTPLLRKTAWTPPFMHNARYTNLRDIIDHYNRAPAATLGVTELRPLHLTPVEMQQLESFLLTLTAPVNAPAEFLANPFVTP